MNGNEEILASSVRDEYEEIDSSDICSEDGPETEPSPSTLRSQRTPRGAISERTTLLLPPPTDIVVLLQDLLRKAEAGVLTDIAVAGVLHGGIFTVYSTETKPAYALVGAFEEIKYRLLKE